MKLSLTFLQSLYHSTIQLTMYGIRYTVKDAVPIRYDSRMTLWNSILHQIAYLLIQSLTLSEDEDASLIRSVNHEEVQL